MIKELYEELEAEKPLTRFGTGWMSGVLALTLAMMALFSMVSLQYAGWLSVPEIQNILGDTGQRSLVYFFVITAFLLSCISLILRQNKLFGLLANSLLMLTLLLGSMANLGATKSNVSFGLDWFVLNLLLTGIIFIPLERLFQRRNQSVFRFEWRDDLLYFFVGSIMVQSLALLSLSPSNFILLHVSLNNLQDIVVQQPFYLQLIEIMFLTDLVQYWLHRILHQVPFLWKFHAIHHSTQAMDWLAGSRMHFIEIIVLRSLTIIPMNVLGFSQTAIYTYLIIVYLYSTYLHANLKFDVEWVKPILATPRFHHWHHGIEKEAIDVNFSIHFPILDRIFGTYYMPKSKWPSAYGIKNHPIPSGYLKQFLYPFKKN